VKHEIIGPSGRAPSCKAIPNPPESHRLSKIDFFTMKFIVIKDYLLCDIIYFVNCLASERWQQHWKRWVEVGGRASWCGRCPCSIMHDAVSVLHDLDPSLSSHHMWLCLGMLSVRQGEHKGNLCSASQSTISLLSPPLLHSTNDLHSIHDYGVAMPFCAVVCGSVLEVSRGVWGDQEPS
jgi:hypothetical protein